MLAALCDRDEPIIAPDDDGTFFLDRDWWIFRHILNWLRTDALPQDPMVLLEMYNEAMFYRVEGLSGDQRAPPARLPLQGRAELSWFYISIVAWLVSVPRVLGSSGGQPHRMCQYKHVSKQLRRR